MNKKNNNNKLKNQFTGKNMKKKFTLSRPR